MSINRLDQFEGGLYSFATTHLVVSLPTKISFSDHYSKFNTVQERKLRWKFIKKYNLPNERNPRDFGDKCCSSLSTSMRCLLLFLALMVSANAQKLLQSRQFVLDADYDKEDPPPNPGGMNKTFIQATFNLRNILDLSETLERISLEVNLPIPQFFNHQTFVAKGLPHSFLVRREDWSEQDFVARGGWERQVVYCTS